MTYSRLHKFCIGFYFTSFALLGLLSILRLLEIANSAELIKVFLVLLLPALVVLVYTAAQQKLIVDWTVFLLLFVIVWGGLVSVARENSFLPTLQDTVAISIAMLAYISSLQKWAATGTFIPLIRYSSGVILAAALWIVGIGYMLKFGLGYELYFSLSDVTLIIALSWGLAARKKGIALLSLLCIALGGKIGVLAAAVLVFLVHFGLTIRARSTTIGVATIILFAALNGFMYWSVDNELPTTEGPLASLANKLLVYYNPYQLDLRMIDPANLQDTPLEDIGGGRLSEIIYSMSKLDGLPFKPFLTGGGSGFTYDMWYMGEFRPDTKNAHFTPASLIGKFGIPLTVILYAVVIWKVLKAYKRIRHLEKQSPVHQTMLYFCAANILFSFTAYSFFNVVVFWFFLGLLSNRAFWNNPDVAPKTAEPPVLSKGVSCAG